jgi:octaprenyl-diphosphate synthase
MMNGRFVMMTRRIQPMADSTKIGVSQPMSSGVETELPASMNAERIFSLVRSDLARVEEEFERYLTDASGDVSAIGRYLREGGGKRVRPALLLMASRMVCGDAPAAAVHLSAVVEMLHTATLVHDDIIDDSGVRRGRPSANARWGNNVTVLMGDWLYMTAYDVALRERNFDVLDILTRMTRLMVEGEIIQLSLIGNSRITREQHLDIVRRKTAWMFAACAEVGGIVAGAGGEARASLSRYGLSVGIAFQLIDDVLDFTSTEEKLGKPVASDLREGKLTLPLIYLLDEGGERHREMVETVMRERGFESVSRDEVLAAIRHHGALDRAIEDARRFADEAIESLSIFPLSDYKQALTDVPRFIIEREM